jgi:hypothetical protein
MITFNIMEELSVPYKLFKLSAHYAECRYAECRDSKFTIM